MLRTLPGAFKVVMVEAAGEDPAKEERVKAILEGDAVELRFGPRMWGGWNRVFVHWSSVNATGKFPQVLALQEEIGPSSARGARRGSERVEEAEEEAAGSSRFLRRIVVFIRGPIQKALHSSPSSSARSWR